MNYRDNFDHLGQMREGDHHPWTLADKIICGLCWVVVAALCIGII